MARRVYACLWDGADLKDRPGSGYGVEHVERLRDMIGDQAELHLVADQPYEVEGVTVHEMLGVGCGGWTPVMEVFAPHLWPETYGQRYLAVGLDTVVTGDLGWLFEWDESPVGIPLDPYFAPEPCNAVISYTIEGAASLWKRYMQLSGDWPRRLSLFRKPSEMMMMRELYRHYGWEPLEAEPEKLLSYKVHVRDQGRDWSDASIVYFHGEPRPNELPDDDPLKERWLGSSKV